MKISHSDWSANTDLPLYLIIAVKRLCGFWSLAGFRTSLDQLGTEPLFADFLIFKMG